jgi:hypothetical protein
VKAPSAGAKTSKKSRLHKKATFTLPPEVIESIDKHWRFHKTLGRSLADSKSEYLADLVRRDAAKKTDEPRKA